MLRFALTRLSLVVPTFIGITLLVFVLIRLIPGDPIETMAGERGIDPARLAQLRKDYGFDQPVLVQYGFYLSRLVHGDFGRSIVTHEPVIAEFQSLFPATVELSICAILFALCIGLPAGIIAAVRRNSIFDHGVMGISLTGYSMPIFWWGLLLILLFSVKLGWLPSFGYETVGAGYTGLRHALDVAAHLVMPAATLGLFFMATYTRMTRASMLEVRRLDFVKTARAKGLRDGVILRRHVLRNALLPVVTLAGVHAGTLVGGAVLTETVFAWPGIGRLMYDALIQRDYNLLLGVFVVSSAMVLIFNLITDLVYRLVDPRIEYAS